jgi:hypothetical protein
VFRQAIRAPLPQELLLFVLVLMQVEVRQVVM